MKENTIKLLFWVALVYVAILLIAGDVLSLGSTQAISLTAIPLIIVAAVIIRDLANRSTSPTTTVVPLVRERREGREVEFLSRQIDVTAKASTSYFEDIVLARLRELLVNKASMELGLEVERVRQILSDSKQGPEFLKDEALYRLLYSPSPARGRARIEMIRQAVDLIEAWKA